MKKVNKYQANDNTFSEWGELGDIKLFDEISAWKKILNETSISDKSRKIGQRSILKYAAVLFVLVSAAFLFQFYFVGNISILNEGPEGQLVMMEDQSEIILSPGSEISFKRSYNWSNRIIKLKGEAFFNIEKNDQKAFELYFDDSKIKVLGTSFYVQTSDTKPSAKVELVEGRIKLTSGGLSDFMEEGQEAKIINDKIEIAAISAIQLKKEWEGEALLLNNVSIAKACSMINDLYGTELITMRDGLKGGDCKIHTTVKPGALDEFIEELNIVFKIKIRNYKGRFIIEKINC